MKCLWSYAASPPTLKTIKRLIKLILKQKRSYITQCFCYSVHSHSTRMSLQHTEAVNRQIKASLKKRLLSPKGKFQCLFFYFSTFLRDRCEVTVGGDAGSFSSSHDYEACRNAKGKNSKPQRSWHLCKTSWQCKWPNPIIMSVKQSDYLQLQRVACTVCLLDTRKHTQ